MRKFVSHECSTSDFACTVYFLIRNNIKKSECLIKDFELVLEGFIPEPTANLTEDELRQIVKNILPKVQKYFTDEI